MRRCEFLLEVGRIEDALSPCEQAAALRPFAPPTAFVRVRALLYSGQIEQAWQALEEASMRLPRSFWVNTLRWEVFVNTGRSREAAAMLTDAEQRPFTISPEGVPALEAGFKAAATRAPLDVAAAINDLSTAVAEKRLHPAYAIGMVSRLGRIDEVVLWLTRAYQVDVWPRVLLFSPSLASLRRDPRFMTIAARSGLVSYWRKTGVWPDFCADSTLPYDCQAEAGSSALEAIDNGTARRVARGVWKELRPVTEPSKE
jgi:hypothetical protein